MFWSCAGQGGRLCNWVSGAWTQIALSSVAFGNTLYVLHIFTSFLHPLSGFLTSYDILCAFLAAPVSDRSTPRAGCAAVSLPLPLSLPRELQPSFVTISVVVDVGGGIIARPEEELFPPWAPWLAKCKWTLDFVEVHSLALI